MLRRLPLLLVAAMVAIGIAIESVGFGDASWLPKLPLIALLALAFLRSRRAGGAR